MPRKVYAALGALVVALGVVVTVMLGSASAAPANFVYRNGTQLMLNGAPYQFVGFNAYNAASGCSGTPWTNTQMDTYFSQLPPASMTRVWAFSQAGTTDLDRLVASAASHNQKLNLVLENDFADCTSTGVKSNTWYTSTYQGAYITWVKTVAARYANSPAVGMYEAVNEAGQAWGEGTLSGTMMQSFYQATATAIKSVDPNHLVGTGDSAEFVYTSASAYQTASSGAAVDVMSLHDYERDYGGAEGSVSSHWSASHNAAMALGKPIIIGEMNESACSQGTTSRANNVSASMQAYLDAGAGGVDIWDRTFSLNDCQYEVIAPDPLITTVQNWVVPGVVPSASAIGSPTPTSTAGPNLALNKPAVASSLENSTFPASDAVDSSATTRWSSAFSQPQWIYVDLGATYNVNRVLLSWEAAYATGYQIQVSANASTWTNIYSTTTGNGATDDLTGLSGTGRYVRMNGTARATAYGFSLFDFQVYGTLVANSGVQYSALSKSVSMQMGTDQATMVHGGTMTAGAKVSASVLQAMATFTADEVVLAVRDPNGAGVDFPSTLSYAVGSSLQTYEKSKVFNTVGSYTYFFAYRVGTVWIAPGPIGTFTVS